MLTRRSWSEAEVDLFWNAPEQKKSVYRRVTCDVRKLLLQGSFIRRFLSLVIQCSRQRWFLNAHAADAALVF